MIESRTRESLILRLPRAGDAEAWQEFAAIYEPLVYRFARQRGLQDADARELVQEVFVSVAKAVSGFKPDAERGKFRTWLFCIARNHLISLLRKRRPDCGSGSTSQFAKLQQVASDELPDEELLLEYQRELFRSAAACVRDQVKETTWQGFWMTCVEELSVEEAAKQLGTTPGAIYIARSRVLHRLRELVRCWENQDA